jgi:hypothetical protein
MTPASIRNMNPGAMYPGPSSKRFGSTSFEVLRSKDGVHKIATFPTHQHGAAALFDLMSRKYTGRTVETAIKTWCGGYYVDTYCKVLEEKGGVARTAMMDAAFIRDPARAIPFAKAMAWQEAGQDYPLDEAGWAAAHTMAFAGEVAPAHAPDNDVPSPKPETREDLARKVAAATGGVGAVATMIPNPPDTSAIESWSAFGNKAVELGSWALHNPIALGIVAIAAAALAAPKLLGRS